MIKSPQKTGKIAVNLSLQEIEILVDCLADRLITFRKIKETDESNAKIISDYIEEMVELQIIFRTLKKMF